MYDIFGANLPIPDHTPPPDAPVGPEGPIHEVNGATSTMLTPSPPPTPEDIIEEVPATIEESSIRPDEVSTFTNPGRPVPQPYGFYGARFDMEPSTELTHVRARAEIFGDAASPSSGDRSGTQESQDARHWTSDVAALQSRTERLQERVKHGLKKVQDSIGQKARKVRVAEQIVFQRMGSVTRRGVERKLVS